MTTSAHTDRGIHSAALVWITALFASSFMAVVCMASFSRYNAHPDEYLHIGAIQFYQTNWLPPKICDDRSLPTYSKYGFSYLDKLGSSYFLAGKLLGLLLPFTRSQPLLAVRGFNVGLLFLLYLLLILLIFQDVKNVAYAIPLCISPQVWYIFSYANNDAFPFFLMMGITLLFHALFIAPPSDAPKGRKNTVLYALLGTLLGALLLEKTNYLVFIAGFCACTAIQCLFTIKKSIEDLARLPAVCDMKRVLKPVSIVCFMLAGVLAARHAVDFSVNGFDRKGKKITCAERTAHKEFKPSTMKAAPGTSYFGLRLKDKGVPFVDIFTKWKWGNATFQSFCGAYGWMEHFHKPGYYLAMKLFYMLICVLLLQRVCPLHFQKAPLVLLVTIVSTIGMIGVSAYHSWAHDFQAQGRYLFPVLGLFSLSFRLNWERLSPKLLCALVTIVFLFGLCSFLFTGIARTL